jgi:DNA-binding CsgD family transcriptional regulator
MPKIRKLVLAIMLLAVAILSSSDIISELDDFFSGNVSFLHVLTEGLVLLLSLMIVLQLLWEYKQQYVEQKNLQQQLLETKQQLEVSHILLREGKKHFRKVIDWQFRKWSLTKSEQIIALLLLKGLSFKEIAILRHTQEKTVRHHASAIYSKSGLGGRHALAAWFFEDLL